MAHSLESRVPLLDHRLVELAATIPADSKFKDGHMKHVFKEATRPLVPDVIADRKDKMGFPVPLTDWMGGPARDFFHDVFSSDAAAGRQYVDNRQVRDELGRETRFGRKVWGLLSLELWQRAFHDREDHFKRLLTEERTATTT
jgi:asparagine synthase (glutamine-hydrolysing)